MFIQILVANIYSSIIKKLHFAFRPAMYVISLPTLSSVSVCNFSSSRCIVVSYNDFDLQFSNE